MPDRYRVKYTPAAYQDLKQIFDFIELDSPQNAPEMIRRIVEDIESLDILPHRYKPVINTEKLPRNLRSMPVRPFLVRYSIDESTRTLQIHSIRHGARGPE